MKAVLLVLVLAVSLAGCQKASKTAMEEADKAAYKPVDYVNASIAGPQIVVLPGAIKSANATFTQKISENNIADFAEIELTKANFKVLERSDLGALTREIEIAVGMGDQEALKRFRKGRFQATRWFLRFDVLKAEPVAAAQQKFDGKYLGVIAGAIVGQATDSAAAGAATGAAVASAKSEDASEVWLVGLRYKILDAVTGEQAATGYFEEKMEIGQKMSSFLGFTQAKGQRVGLDTVSQILVQKAVAEIDASYKKAAPAVQTASTEADRQTAPEEAPAVPKSPDPQAKAAAATEAVSQEASIQPTEGGGVRMDPEAYARIQQSVREQSVTQAESQ